MHTWKIGGCVASLVVAGVLCSALPGSAQKNKPKVDAVVGYVDLAQVTEQIKQTADWQVMVKQFEDEKGKARTEIEGLTKVRYLTDAERTELQNLQAKQKPSGDEKARIEELLAKSPKMEQEYQALAMVEKPNDEQAKRIKDLAQMREKASGSLQDEYDKRAQKLQQKEAELLDSMQTKILKYVEQVADGKGLQMVVDRQAILFGGQDLTADVIKKLK